jgi:hypothetical protein
VVKKLRDQAPAAARELSWPSFADEHINICPGSKSLSKGKERLTHVRGDKHPLRQLIVVQVFIEHSEVLGFSQSVGI